MDDYIKRKPIAESIKQTLSILETIIAHTSGLATEIHKSERKRLYEVLDVVSSAPHENVRPFERGEWQDVKIHCKIPRGTCSVCNQRAEIGAYCLHCGSIMGVGDE